MISLVRELNLDSKTNKETNEVIIDIQEKEVSEQDKQHLEKWEKLVEVFCSKLVSLDQYIRSNTTAFQKIIKKYDKQFERTVKPWVLQNLEKESFNNHDLNYFLTPLSEIFEYLEIKKESKKKSVEGFSLNF
jgi:SPX domain protein involved in polyphosphate accumulation